MLTFQVNSIKESSSSLYCSTAPTTTKMPVHCLDQQSSPTTLIHDSNQNGGGDNSSSSPSILATMMTIIPDSNCTTSSTYQSYYNNEIETSNNNNNNDNTMNTSKTSTISNEQQHFNSDNHYTIIKSSTTLSLSSSSATSSSASTPSPSYDDNNSVVSNNQEKTLTLLDNNTVNVDNPSFTMLGGSSQDTLPPPLLLPENIYYHNQYYQQIQLNITVPTGSVTTGTGSGTIQQQQTFPIIYDPEQISKINYGLSSSSYLEIIEQPTNRIRYRYRSEKGSHGGLNGANSSQIKKTYPTIKIVNYHHSNPVYIRASLATNDDNNPPRSHVHKLMGRHCSDDGSCTLAISENMTAVFQNLGILFIGKKEVPEILFKRKLMELRSSNYSMNESCSDKLRERLREEAEKEAKDFNLNSVRLCFEAFMLHNNALYPICPMVYSRPIANQKSPDSGELKIVRINRFYGSVTGGDEIYLLCEKVNKKEIRVRFFENTDSTHATTDGSQAWEAFGDFNESDVHHQVAIVFRTPPYKNQQITKPIQVYIQLYRQRDGEYSEPKTFIYKPKSIFNQQNNDSEDLVSNNGLQECVLTRNKTANQSLGFKRRKYTDSVGRINCYQNNNKSNGKSSTTSLSITSSSPNSSSSSSSSSCSSLSSNNNNISYDNIIIKKELDNEINLISYATTTTTIPTIQPNYSEQQDLCSSMDVSHLNQIPKHPNHSQNVNNDIDMKKSNESCCSIRKYTNTNSNNLQYCSSSPSPSSTNNGTSSPCISPNNHHGLSSNLRNGNIVPVTSTLMPEPQQHPNDFNHLDSIWTPPLEQQSILLDYPNCCSHSDNPNNVFRSSNNNTSAANECIQTSSVGIVTSFQMMNTTNNNPDDNLIDNQLCSSSYNHLQYNSYNGNDNGDVSTLYSL